MLSVKIAVLLLAALTGTFAAAPVFRFSTVYGDHMVLQQAPHKAVVWGFISNCSPVTVEFNNGKITADIVKTNQANLCKWVAALPAMKGGSTPYIISAMSGGASIGIKDVLFGDVWVCSGQSNMQFTVAQVYNASAEIAAAQNYSMVRLFTAALESSSTPMDELISIEQNWTVASPSSVGGKAWGYFSATCWFFGKNLFDKLKYPIGLVDSDWGGTPVEAWSSPDALAKCNPNKTPPPSPLQPVLHSKSKGPKPGTPSVLWNAMIVPFLNMTIKGAIWYQGEANAGAPQSYHCTFPAMIDDWRTKWFTSSGQNTDEKFGFGFVQLAPTGNNNISSTGFPDIRWAQTANYGFVPNDRLQNVFMAVAIDLGDPTSPYGSVHPRDKQDVGMRLANAGLAVVYGQSAIDYRGPIATTAKLASSGDSAISSVSVTYDSKYALEMRYEYGFELGCTDSSEKDVWIEGTAKSVDKMTAMVEFPVCPSGAMPAMIRYCWRTDPCTFMKCPIYANGLPSPPFILKL